MLHTDGMVHRAIPWSTWRAMCLSCTEWLGWWNAGVLTMKPEDPIADPGTPSDTQQLIRDAEILGDYAARTGALPEGSTIFISLETLRNPKDGDTATAKAALYKDIRDVAKAILPMTLYKLKRRGSFQGKLRASLANSIPFAVGFLTLLLTLYLAFQSSELQKADTALKEYQQWADERPKEKIYNAWKMFRYDRVLNDSRPPQAQLDAYNRTVYEAKRLVDKGAAIQDLLVNASTTLILPRFLGAIGPPWVERLVQKLNGEEEPTGKGGTELTYGNGADAKQCSAMLRNASMEGSPANAQSAFDLGTDVDSQKCFLTLLNINSAAADYSPFISIYPTKSKVNLLTVWLLPWLYGMLGACVYLMRDFVLLGGLRRLTQDPTLLSMLALLLRVTLGGLAGIIIGWFWVPPPISGNTAAIPISSIPFGLSFLAGFSIETLFSLVERLKHVIETDRERHQAAPNTRPT